jgi:outer membrane protein assembly factor BamE
MKKIILAAAALLAACSFSNPVKPYKIDVQQGNVVTQDMVAKLRPGMTKAQVRYILGTPLLTDIFHGNRWDYVYRYQKDGKLTEERRLFVYFEGDLLVRVGGDVAPGSPEDLKPAEPKVEQPETPPVQAKPLPPEDGTAPATAPAPGASDQPQTPPPAAKPAPAEEEKGFFGKLMEKVGL